MCVMWVIPYLFIRVAVHETAAVVIGYSVAPVILVRFLSKVPSMGVTAVALTATGIAYAPIALLTWPAHIPSTSAIVAVVVLAVVCTALGFVFFFALISEISAVRAPVLT